MGGVGSKGIAGQALGAGLEIFEVELADEVGAIEVEVFVEVVLLGETAGTLEEIGADGAITE